MSVPVVAPDFEAEVRFLTVAEGGRLGPPIQGMYRPDISYDGDPAGQVFMVWPWFFGENGEDLPEGTTIPPATRARFYIASDNARPVLRRRTREGLQFYLNEGRKRVAVCRVTKILSLNRDAA